MTSDRDLRAAVEALADEWERTYCAKPRTLGFNEAFLRDLRAILAEHPATPAEASLRERLYVALVEQRCIDSAKYGEAPYAPITPEDVDRHLAEFRAMPAEQDDWHEAVARDMDARWDNDGEAEPDAEGEGLTEAEVEALLRHTPYWRSYHGDKAREFLALVKLILADRERRAEARRAERAWSQGYVAGRDDYRGRVDVDRQTPNPYRADRIAGEGQ